MRTTIDLPDDLYRQIKARAALGGQSVRELVTRYLEAGLHSLPDAEPAVGRSAIPVAIAPGGRPIPALSREQLQQIDEDDERRC
jgi:hypothetical protein